MGCEIGVVEEVLILWLMFTEMVRRSDVHIYDTHGCMTLTFRSHLAMIHTLVKSFIIWSVIRFKLNLDIFRQSGSMLKHIFTDRHTIYKYMVNI